MPVGRNYIKLHSFSTLRYISHLLHWLVLRSLIYNNDFDLVTGSQAMQNIICRKFSLMQTGMQFLKELDPYKRDWRIIVKIVKYSLLKKKY